MLYFFDKAGGYTVAAPGASIAFESADASKICMALNLAGLSDLPAPDLLARCRRILVVPHPETKSVFTRSKIKDQIRKIAELCEKIGSGTVAWE